MNNISFKTNINCENCINAISPILNQKIEIEDWKVDLKSPEKLLTVTGEVKAEEVLTLIQEAGFKAEKVVT